MTIHIDDMQIEAIIGLLDFERIAPQQVVVNLELDYEYTKDEFINYANLVALIQEDIGSRQYILLEDALLSLKELIISTYPMINRLKLKIAKPDIIPEAIVALSDEWSW